jgi:hypothetical protein
MALASDRKPRLELGLSMDVPNCNGRGWLRIIA